MKPPQRFAVALATLTLVHSPCPRAAEPPAALRKLVADHCVKCHSGDRAKGKVRLDVPDIERAVWEKTRRQLTAGTMPPRGEPRPPEPALRAASAALATLLAQNVGPAPMRRLNRAQYRNTIRDLFGIDFDPTGLMPADDVGHGFDNVGAAQRMSAVLLRHYLRMAQEVAARVVVADPADVAPVVAELEWRTEGVKKPAKLPPRYFGQRLNKTLDFPVTVPADDEYLLKVWLVPENLGDRPQVLLVEVGGQEVGRLETLDLDLTWHRLKLRLPAGKHIIQLRMAPVERTKKSSPTSQVILVEHLLLTRPKAVTPEHYPAAHRRVMIASPTAARSGREAARLILTPLARRAFRRPASAVQVDGLLRVFDAAVADGEAWELAVRRAIEAMLCSPRFLFLTEAPAGARPTGLVDEFELASRLSYFLWNSMPDESLLEVAGQGKLRAELDAQVTRMLADPKFEGFAESFSSQWLGLSALANFRPEVSNAEFAAFNENLRAAMKRETTLFFAAVVRENLSLMKLLDADFTFVNRPLAELYNLPFDRAKAEKLKPGELIRVDLKRLNGQRGGLLTQAAVLASTSYSTRTSPVLRGAWILDRLLGDPPPPPPPDVPPLDKIVMPGEFVPVRRQLELHRQNAACAACHNRIDPLGFALENYNALGRFRSDEVFHHKAEKRTERKKIDATAALPSGEKLEGVAGLKKVLAGPRKPDFLRNFTIRLLTYALGCGVEETAEDRVLVQGLLDVLAKDEERAATLIRALVRHEAFQRVR